LGTAVRRLGGAERAPIMHGSGGRIRPGCERRLEWWSLEQVRDPESEFRKLGTGGKNTALTKERQEVD